MPIPKRGSCCQQFAGLEHKERLCIDRPPRNGIRPDFYHLPVESQLIVFSLLDLILPHFASGASRPFEIQDNIVPRFILEQQVNGSGNAERLIIRWQHPML